MHVISYDKRAMPLEFIKISVLGFVGCCCFFTYKTLLTMVLGIHSRGKGFVYVLHCSLLWLTQRSAYLK